MSVGMEMPYGAYQRNLHRQPQVQQHQGMGGYVVGPANLACMPQTWQQGQQRGGGRQQHWSGPNGRESYARHQQMPSPAHHQVAYAHHPGFVPVFAAVPTWSHYAQPLYDSSINEQRMLHLESGHPFQQLMPYHVQQMPVQYRSGGNNATWPALRQNDVQHSNGKHLVPAQISAPIRAGAAPRRAAPSSEAYDHPSHFNPPHREDTKRRAEAPAQFDTKAAHSITPLLPAFNDNCSTGDLQATDYQLIPADATAVPPHPPVEKSGVPFAAFAAEFLWEICADARELAAAAASSPRSPRDRTNVGAIGSERALRHSKMNSNSSLKSMLYGSAEPSPTSTVGPLTPVASGRTLDDVFHVRRHSFGKTEIIDCFSTPPSNKPVSIWNNDAFWPEASPEADRKRSLSRSRSTLQQASTEFKDYVTNLLTVTLVTPQVLLLALHYAKALPSDILANAYTAELAPFRLLLGCLIVANKHLDDNSFRCSTWAQVSTLNIKQVVAAETFVLKAFAFEINVDSSVWLNFMHTLTERRARTNPLPDDPVLGRLLDLVDTAAAWPY